MIPSKRDDALEAALIDGLESDQDELASPELWDAIRREALNKLGELSRTTKEKPADSR